MARIKKLKENGATIYPATIPQAVVDPTTGKTLADMQGHIAFVNSSDAINIDNYPQNDYGTIAIWFNPGRGRRDTSGTGRYRPTRQNYRSERGESGSTYVDCLTQLYVGQRRHKTSHGHRL